jgi:Nuclease-related domain
MAGDACFYPTNAGFSSVIWFPLQRWQGIRSILPAWCSPGKDAAKIEDRGWRGTPSPGNRTFHDLIRDGFNIDHVVVGPAGVFAVETKFRSGHGEIEFRNGEGLFVGGFPEEKDSLKQARASAAEVNRIIKDNCNFDEWVWPLVVFVGDWRVRNDFGLRKEADEAEPVRLCSGTFAEPPLPRLPRKSSRAGWRATGYNAASDDELGLEPDAGLRRLRREWRRINEIHHALEHVNNGCFV